MTVSRTKLERPAKFNDFTLSVDDLIQPTRVSAGRVTGPHEANEEVATWAYSEVVNADALVEWLVGTVGFPLGAAKALGVQLAEKVHAASLRA